MQCGPIRYRVDAKEQALKCSIEHYVTPVFTDFRIAESGLTYAELCAKLCADETRNDRIANDVIAAYSSGRNPIALTERKEHADLLGSLIAPRCNNLFVLSGKDSAKEKREKLEAIKTVPNHENMIILATGKYVGEGFDEPRLDTLFLAMPISWEGTLAQYAGRLHRSYEGKTEVRIYDYADIFVPALERSYLKRVKGYAKLGYMMIGADSRDRNIIFNSQNYQARFFEDIGSVVSEIIISSAKVKLSYLNKLLEAIPESVKLIVITQQSERDDLIDFNAENCVIQYEEKVNQTFTLIDGRIVWYGDISPLTYNYKEASAIRLINSSLALNLRVNALHESLALV